MQTKEEKAAYMKKWREKHRQKWSALMHSDQLKCSVCGYKNFVALDFHHTEPGKKDFGIGEFIRKSFTEKNKRILLKELGKCICMCSNCHREFHDLQRKLQEDSK